MVHEPVLNLVLTLVHLSPLTSPPLPSHPSQHRVDLLFIMRLGSTFKIFCCLTEGFFLAATMEGFMISYVVSCWVLDVYICNVIDYHLILNYAPFIYLICPNMTTSLCNLKLCFWMIFLNQNIFLFIFKILCTVQRNTSMTDKLDAHLCIHANI